MEEVGWGWNTWFPSGLVYNALCDLSKSPRPWEPALVTPRLQTPFQNFNGASSVQGIFTSSTYRRTRF